MPIPDESGGRIVFVDVVSIFSGAWYDQNVLFSPTASPRVALLMEDYSIIASMQP